MRDLLPAFCHHLADMPQAADDAALLSRILTAKCRSGRGNGRTARVVSNGGNSQQQPRDQDVNEGVEEDGQRREELLVETSEKWVATCWCVLRCNLLTIHDDAERCGETVHGAVTGAVAASGRGSSGRFVLGLLGFVTTVGINVWLNFGGAVGKVLTCAVCSALLLMLSIVNDAAGKGAGSLLGIFARYFGLLVQACVGGKRLLVMGSLGFATAAVVLAVRELPLKASS